MNRSVNFLTLSGLLAFVAFPSAAVDEARTDLAAGQVVISSEKIPHSNLRVAVGSRVIDAPPARVFRALVDYAHYEEFMPFLEESRVLSGDARSAEVAQRLDLPWPLGSRRFRVRIESEAEGPEHSVSWRYVVGSGELRAHEGSIVVSAFAPNRSLVVCRLVLDPGEVSSALANRTAAQSVPWILDGLRQHVNRSRYDAAH